MMWTLLRKEWRSLRPMRWLIVFFVMSLLVAVMITGSLLDKSVKYLFDEFLIAPTYSGSGFFYAVFAFAIASGLLVREFDDNTIEFLDALPISRSRLFWAKFLAGFGCLAILPIGFSLIGFVLHRFAETSLDRGWHLDLIAVSVFLQLVQLFVLLSIGLMLSFLRRFGWLAIGLIMVAFVFAKSINPAVEVLNVIELTTPDFFGVRRIFPWRMLAFQAPIGMAALISAYVLFNHGGQWLIELSKPGKSRVRQVVMSVAGAGAVATFAGLFAFVMESSSDDVDHDAVRVVYPSWSTASVSTTHYDIVFPTNMSGRAQSLVKEADEIHDSVAALFGYTAKSKITADWTVNSDHFLGTAYSMKLKMSLGRSESIAELRRTLAHETTHVVIESLSENRLKEHFGSTRVFHEGVATYVEERLYLPKEETSKHRLKAAVLHSRGEVDFHTLIDDDRLRREHATELVYDVGEVFAAAIAKRYGDESLGNLARAFAHKNNTEGLRGTPLWRSVFQACGYSLNAVINEFYELLDVAVEEHSDITESLPLANEFTSEYNDAFYVETEQEAPEGWRFVCRFRGYAESPDQEYFDAESIFDGSSFAVFSSNFTRSLAWYQIGLRKGDTTIYEPWKSVPLQ